MSEVASPPQAAIDAAIEAAKLSPCAKSKRGVSVYSTAQTLPFAIVGTGFNHPADGSSCDKGDACRALCREVCIHAETAAVLDALNARSLPYTRPDLELVHVKLDEKKELVAGGPPSCWPCANLIRASGLWAVWLYEDMHEGPTWTRRLAPQFLRSTLYRQPQHPDYEPRNAIELPCGGCKEHDGAKRDKRGRWRCVRCAFPAP